MGIKVLIVDDDALIRDSLKMILELGGEIEIVGLCSNGKEAMQFCCDNVVEVVLMDIRMPICDGIEGTKKIKALYPNIKILILTTFQDDEYIFKALKNGAHGYMLKNTPSIKIKEIIQQVYNGNMMIHADLTHKLTQMLSNDDEKDLTIYGLTDREIEIIKLVSTGLSNKEISEALYLGESTVKNYITIILDKLSLRDRTQLAVFYLKK